MKAWMITWEGTKAPREIEKKIIDVVSKRRSPGFIKNYVDQLYRVLSAYTIEEKLIFARYNPIRTNPYAADFGQCDGSNVRWEGEVIAGHNPWIRARVVSGLEIGCDSKGGVMVAWKEPIRPKVQI